MVKSSSTSISQLDPAAVVLAHPVIKSGGKVADVWGLFMCLTRPWKANNGLMMELMFLFNEFQARSYRRKKIARGLKGSFWSRL